MAEYSICKTKTGKTKKEIVKGVKKVCYKKKSSSKMYVKSKGRMLGLSRYKKMKMKKGGMGGMMDMITSTPQAGGKKSRKRKSRRSK